MQPMTQRHWSCTSTCLGSAISALAIAPHLPAHREYDVALAGPCLTMYKVCLSQFVLGINHVKGFPQRPSASKVDAMDGDVEDGENDWDPTTKSPPRAPGRA
jgi:hypothetical protein